VRVNGPDAVGLAPMVGALPTPAAVIDGGTGRFVVVNQLFAALFPRLMPLGGWLVGQPDGHAATVSTPQHELCRGCGQLAELELTVTERLRDGASSVLLVSCGVGSATALEMELRGLLADVEERVLLVDHAGVVRFASASFETLTGRPGVGLGLAELFDERDRGDVDRLLTESLRHPGRRLVARGRLLDRSGEVRWVEAIARCLAPAGGPAGVVVGLRTVKVASHLGVVAAPAEPAARLGPRELTEAFRALSPAEKAEVIRALQS